MAPNTRDPMHDSHPEAQEVRLADETIHFLEDRMRSAVRDGIADLMSDDIARQFFRTGVAVVREEAAAHTGKFVLSGMWGLAKMGAWGTLIVVAIYAVGGWALLKTVVIAIFAKS